MKESIDFGYFIREHTKDIFGKQTGEFTKYKTEHMRDFTVKQIRESSKERFSDCTEEQKNFH